jgi:hypothetical protein
VAIHLSGPPGGGIPEGTPDGPSVPLFDLAPGGVYRADQVTLIAGALLPHRFTLTCALPGGIAIGGLFSVALSCRSPRLAVSQHPALWSPDLPRPVPDGGAASIWTCRDHPAGSPSSPWSHRRPQTPSYLPWHRTSRLIRARFGDHRRLARCADSFGHKGVLVLRRGTWLPIYPSCSCAGGS